MRKTQPDRRGQSLAEYAVVLALVVGAVVAMQTYGKRALQGDVKGAYDGVKVGNAPDQYEPYYASRDIQTGQKQKSEEKYDSGKVDRAGDSEVTRKGGEQELGASALGNDDAWQ